MSQYLRRVGQGAHKKPLIFDQHSFNISRHSRIGYLSVVSYTIPYTNFTTDLYNMQLYQSRNRVMCSRQRCQSRPTTQLFALLLRRAHGGQLPCQEASLVAGRLIYRLAYARRNCFLLTTHKISQGQTSMMSFLLQDKKKGLLQGCTEADSPIPTADSTPPTSPGRKGPGRRSPRGLSPPGCSAVQRGVAGVLRQ